MAETTGKRLYTVDKVENVVGGEQKATRLIVRADSLGSAREVIMSIVHAKLSTAEEVAQYLGEGREIVEAGGAK